MGNIVTLTDYYNNLANSGRLLDHRFGLTITRSGFEDLTMYAQSASLPARTLNTTELKYFGQTFEIPTTLDEGRRWSIEVATDSDNNFYNQCLEWQSEYASWERSGGGYKGITSITGYTDIYNNSMDKIVDTFAMCGLCPIEVGPENFDHAGDGIVTFELNLLFLYRYNSKRGTNPLR